MTNTPPPFHSYKTISFKITFLKDLFVTFYTFISFIILQKILKPKLSIYLSKMQLQQHLKNFFSKPSNTAKIRVNWLILDYILLIMYFLNAKIFPNA